MIASMNKRLLIVCVALFCFYCTETQAQFRWSGAIEMGLSQNQNLFRSPDTFLDQGRMLSTGSLYQNDRILPVGVDAGIEFRGTTNRIELDYSGSMDIYENYGYLNGEFHSIRLRDTWSASEVLDIRLSVEGRTSKKVGTNALGDELSRIFEYNGVQSTLLINLDLSKRYALRALYTYSLRDYTESEGALSLDSNTHRGALGWTYKGPKKRGRYWRVDAEAEYRLKSYRSYRARDENGLQRDNYPVNQLHYITTELGVERALSKKWTIELGISGRYRYDFFEDYYSYGAGVVELGVEWEPAKRITIDIEVGARRTHFFGKEAPQSSNSDNPLLRYSYLEGLVAVEYDLLNWVSFETFVSTYNRYSNSTLETRLTRRSYETLEAGATLTFDLDRALRR